MLSAMTVGRPSSISCSAKTQVIVEVGGVEHDQQRVGLRSPCCLPSSTSRVTASSGLAGSRL